MENLTTEEFCRDFGACKEGTAFAQNYKTMRECYDALLRGEAGEHSTSWAIWAATRDGVMSDRDIRLFAVRCARRVQHLMTDERSIRALDVAERYANGDATAEELAEAEREAWSAVEAARAPSWASWASVDSAMRAVAWAVAAGVRAMTVAIRASAWSVDATEYVASEGAAEREAQLAILAEFGNPFEEAEK